MITFKAFVPTNARRADGTYNVKIRCTLKRQSRWIATNVFVTDADLTRAKKIKNPYIVAKCDALVKEFRDIVSGLSPFAVEDMEVDDVLKYIRKQKESSTFSLDFIEYGRQYAAKQTGGTGNNTMVALNAFVRYIGSESIDINDITGQMARGFVDFVDNEPKQSAVKPGQKPAAGEKAAHPKIKKKGVSSWKYTSILRSIYKQARSQYNDEDSGNILIPRAPFDSVKVKEGIHEGQRNLGIEVMQKLISADPSSRVQRYAIDVFLLSFCLMGVNLADLYEAAPPVEGIWTYERLKTRKRRRDRARMSVTVPPQLGPILARLRDYSGKRWLRLYKDGKDASAVGYKVNYGLKQWAESEGIEPFTFYAARHSWATIARSADAGVDKLTVDESLNHAGSKIADIYIERDFRLYDAANAKVLALFQFPA